MRNPTVPLTRTRLAAAIALALALTPLHAHGSFAAGFGLLPDLYMAAPYDLQVTRTPGGMYKLRFGTIVWNVGDGPLEVRGRERSEKAMTDVVQIVHRSNGTTRARPAAASIFYSGDGHDHWHIGRFVVAQLGPIPGSPPTDPPVERRLRKIGFCLVDSLRAPAGELRPPNASPRSVYLGCGIRENTKVKMGISAGYGDEYLPFFAHQAIDVTSVPVGAYRLCATVNPEQLWREKAANVDNNSYWFDIQLDPPARTISVTAGGQSGCDTLPPPSTAAIPAET